MKNDDMPREAGSPIGRKTDFAQGILSPDDVGYPDIIKKVLNKPLTLYWRGNQDLLNADKKLAVVGSRQGTSINQRNLRFVLGSVQGLPLTIVSGLALGLDALAHELALENGLPTIAVLGSSVELDEIYPRTNAGLAERILATDGLLISPFPPKSEIFAWNFPIRNQIIAGLADATLVASAASKSGALITARLALEYGKDVFVIPGYVDDPLYMGSNRLLQQGAYPILSATDIIEHFGFSAASPKEYISDDPVEHSALQLLRQRGHTVNELSVYLKVPAQTVNSMITKLELRNIISIGDDGVVRLQ